MDTQVYPTLKMTKVQEAYMSAAHMDTEFMNGSEVNANTLTLTPGVMYFLDMRFDIACFENDVPPGENRMWKTLYAKAVKQYKDTGMEVDFSSLE